MCISNNEKHIYSMPFVRALLVLSCDRAIRHVFDIFAYMYLQAATWKKTVLNMRLTQTMSLLYMTKRESGDSFHLEMTSNFQYVQMARQRYG